jgi:hypothetical protein
MLGALIIIVVMVLAGPMALFVGGALWSTLVGQTLATTVGEPTEEADG